MPDQDKLARYCPASIEGSRNDLRNDWFWNCVGINSDLSRNSSSSSSTRGAFVFRDGSLNRFVSQLFCFRNSFVFGFVDLIIRPFTRLW